MITPRMHWTAAIIGGGISTMLLDAVHAVPTVMAKELAFLVLTLAIKYRLRWSYGR